VTLQVVVEVDSFVYSLKTQHLADLLSSVLVPVVAVVIVTAVPVVVKKVAEPEVTAVCQVLSLLVVQEPEVSTVNNSVAVMVTPTVLKTPTTKMDPAVVLVTSVVKVVVKTPEEAEVVQVTVTPHYNNVSSSQVAMVKETTSTHQTTMIVTTSQESVLVPRVLKTLDQV